MTAILGRPKTPDLENRVNTPPTQTDSSGGMLPPAVRPTYQGPDDGDPLHHTIPLVPGMYPPGHSLQQDYSPQGKKRPLYDSRN